MALTGSLGVSVVLVDGSGRELARFPHVCPVGLPKLLRRLGVACQKRGGDGWARGRHGTFWCAPWVCDLAAALGSSSVREKEDLLLFRAAVERASRDPEWLEALQSLIRLAPRPAAPGDPLRSVCLWLDRELAAKAFRRDARKFVER